MSPQLLNGLGLPHEGAPITTYGLDVQVIAPVTVSCNIVIMVQYMDDLSPVYKLEVLVVPLTAYDLVL